MNKISDKAKRGLEWLGIRVTGSRWAWTAAIGTLALWASTAHGPVSPGNLLPYPAPTPQIPLQYTTDTSLPLAIVKVAYGKLPPAIKGQRKPPCPDDVEQEINGSCWIPLDKKPCPEGKAWIHDGDGKCYLRAMALPRPNAGELEVPYGIARPIE